MIRYWPSRPHPKGFTSKDNSITRGPIFGGIYLDYSKVMPFAEDRCPSLCIAGHWANRDFREYDLI